MLQRANCVIIIDWHLYGITHVLAITNHYNTGSLAYISTKYSRQLALQLFMEADVKDVQLSKRNMETPEAGCRAVVHVYEVGWVEGDAGAICSMHLLHHPASSLHLGSVAAIEHSDRLSPHKALGTV